MPIMYEPQTGMPVQVPEGRVNDFLKRGYRTVSLFKSSAVETELPPEQQVEDSNEETDLVKVNSTTLKELTERFGLSTAQAKELRDSRPYATVEDLIAKLPDIDWVALESQISFE